MAAEPGFDASVDEEAIFFSDSSDVLREIMEGSAARRPEQELCLAIMAQKMHWALWTHPRPSISRFPARATVTATGP